jgi:hypothetical protein
VDFQGAAYFQTKPVSSTSGHNLLWVTLGYFLHLVRLHWILRFIENCWLRTKFVSCMIT